MAGHAKGKAPGSLAAPENPCEPAWAEDAGTHSQAGEHVGQEALPGWGKTCLVEYQILKLSGTKT